MNRDSRLKKDLLEQNWRLKPYQVIVKFLCAGSDLSGFSISLKRILRSEQKEEDEEEDEEEEEEEEEGVCTFCKIVYRKTSDLGR